MRIAAAAKVTRTAARANAFRDSGRAPVWIVPACCLNVAIICLLFGAPRVGAGSVVVPVADACTPGA